MNNISTSSKLAALMATGMSGAEIARATRIPQPTVSRIARGKHIAPKEPAVRAIDALYERVMSDKSQAA